PGVKRRRDYDRGAWIQYWSREWRRRRAMSAERRRMEVEEILQRPVFLPGWLDELLEECREEFTPRQIEALVYRYGYELSLGEAATALGIKRMTFRKRLAQAKAKVAHLRGDVLREAEVDQRLAKLAEEYEISGAEVHTTSLGVNKDFPATRDVSPKGED